MSRSVMPHSYNWSHQLHQAASEGNTRQLRHLLEEGNSPNTRGGVYCWLRGAYQPITRTALHYAAKEGHLECVRVLLISGADPNIKDEDGYTPLHYSCQIFKPSADRHDKLRKCVESLIEFGGDVHAETNAQRTPTILARTQNNDVCYRQIADHICVVPSLLDLARYKVTRLIHSHHLPPAQQLCLPESLIRLLAYEDVISRW